MKENEIQKWDKEFDVVVVGGGCAGFSAAIEAGRAGAKVLLVEKRLAIGGSSIMATGGFAAAQTSLQKEKGINDSPDMFFKDMMAFGEGRTDEALVRALVDGSNEAFEFVKALGGKCEPDLLAMLGMSALRVHVVDAVSMMKGMKDEATKLGVEIMTKTAGKRLYTNPNGRVVGIKAETETGTKKAIDIKARKAVILATGGFVRNTDLLKEYDIRRTDVCIPVAGLGSHGDGLKMGFEVGAGAKNMAISINEGAPVSVETTVINLSNFSGAVIVNKEGKRFINEAKAYYKIAELCTAQPDGLMIYIADQPIYDVDRTLMWDGPKKADTLQELAVLLGLKPEVLVAEIDKYNRYVEV